ncbi:rhamnulokinase [Pedobacter sp. AW31-3R]|uniref:rhamnulokinase n=1 Tax=Pedobacter sp. AW31-3R TaxID=3445781 RepID=UPI003F9F5B57
MKTSYHFFAFDLGATSGRSLLAKIEDNTITFRELTRFPNKITKVHGQYHWNIFALFEALKDGLKAAVAQGLKIDAIGIDTWGVDFVYLGKDGCILSEPRCYRDPYTDGIPEEYFNVIPKKEVYEATGIQIMNFNSLYQLFAAKKEHSSALEAATGILFMPDALSYLLTGKKVCEYTIASTSQLLNPRTKTFESKLFEAIPLSSSLMQPIVMPGEVIGELTESIMKECGIGPVPVIAVAGHDTGSAVVAVPTDNENFAYLSSGTWSLMGIEVKDPIINEESFALNFTNEGGVNGTTRFLKNITGMWLLEQCRKEWESTGLQYSYEQIVNLSDTAEGFRSLIDPDHESFANPESMTEAIRAYCRRTAQEVPASHAEFIRCIFDSLALKYRKVLESLQQLAPFKIEKLHVIGGGSQNRLLNQSTANSIGIPVVSGPSEATAIGNIMMQAKGIGLVNALCDIRKMVRNSVEPEIFFPEDTLAWTEAYYRFSQILANKYEPLNIKL